MKLFFCINCGDVVKIDYKVRRCKCKKTYGYAVDTLKNECQNAYVSEGAIPFALDNTHLGVAWHRWHTDKRTSFIHGWTIDPTDKKNDCTIIKK